MPHVAFHLAEEFIPEDLDYYFSTRRDKNNQIRPDDNIHSMTPTSPHLSVRPNSRQVTNFFYPCPPNFADRIYIGISVPLFANNWGAAFLLQLLKTLTPGGAIILPVYPEGQAQEKGYWSRSFLENVFLSRQRWTGFSNVTAENDGVMSLRVGRKWPGPMPSTIEWFYQQRANLVLARLLESDNDDDVRYIYTHAVAKVWRNYHHSAVVESIISDNFGTKTPVTVQSVSDDYGLLVTDLLLSPYVNVSNAITHDIASDAEIIARNFKAYFAPHVKGRHQIIAGDVANIVLQKKSRVICLINALTGLSKSAQEALLRQAWGQVESMGLLIIYEDLQADQRGCNVADLRSTLEKFGDVQIYSSIVATKIHAHIDISHYSSIQESRLIEEKREQTKAFRVVQKTT